MEVVVTDRAPSCLALSDMPSEILINICAYLDYKDLVRCSRINRRLRDVCAHDAHWKRLCNKYWLETELPENSTWKLQFFSLYRNLRRYAHCYAQIKSAWEKIRHFMKENCPIIFQSIRGGTSEEQLDEAERKLGVRFPDDLRCSYRIHNGQRLASPGLMGSMSIPSHYRSEFMLDIETAVTGFQSREGLEGCMPLTFCLHSGQSQLIALRDTDGHVPFTVFYPSHDPVDYFITGRSFTEWFTSYGEMLHRKEFVVLDGQPYRFYHEPGCEQMTGYTSVKVATCFVPELSTINPPHFFHTYRITMSMSEEASEQDSCQLETRHWIITDENGKEQSVDGRGVVGEYPVMYPGTEFSWISCANLPTTYGNMKGHFVMRNLQTGDLTEVYCPVFHMKCLPYVTSVEREALKREKHALKKAQ